MIARLVRLLLARVRRLIDLDPATSDMVLFQSCAGSLDGGVEFSGRQGQLLV